MDQPAATAPAQTGNNRPALIIPMLFVVALLATARLPMFWGHPRLFPTMLGAAGLLGAWSIVLFVTARRAGRTLRFESAIKKQHWVQACAQIAIFLYWGWYVRTVYAFLPLILAQLLFAYGVDALLNWSRRDTYRMGFGPMPIVLSINLFLLFHPDWFFLQFAMILVGYLAKDLIRWQRDGRSSHIFNPSSFPLGVFALALLLTGGTDVTFGPFIAQSQFVPPHIYALIFLVSIPGQILFGVARMTLTAVLSMMVISSAYLAVTGVYMFRDAFISLPVFLGMHLLFTDPSTSPRTESGQIFFGVLYALGVTFFFFVLDGLGLPTFYEKLLPVPIMNLFVRRIDAMARSGVLSRLSSAGMGEAVYSLGRNLAYTSSWVVAFGLFSATGLLGDTNPGQYYPYWQAACAAGNERACEYQTYMAFNYCNRGSGWACNEFAIRLSGDAPSDQAVNAFRRSCDLGFEPGCENARRGRGDLGEWSHADPRIEDLPVILRGSKGPVQERDPEALLAKACEQGWGFCDERATN